MECWISQAARNNNCLAVFGGVVPHPNIFHMSSFKSATATRNHSTFSLYFKTMYVTEPLSDRSFNLKGHCHGILASFYNAEICSCLNGNPQKMMQFCYLGLYHCTETIYCRLALSMARMEMD